ncbi:Lon protease family protein, partial [Vibrio sp. V27_P1S3P104]|nr:Lon protease family protein [Vibrio sp. V27_P1S3P104]
MTQDIWRLVTPQYDDFDLLFAQFEQIPVHSFFQTQHRLSQAIERFIQIQGFSRVLLINAPDNSVYRSLVQEHIQNKRLGVPIVRTESLD